jgi:2-oxoisovalerate dehydrogenase E2 component (dihydrolipoyl transacylase)
MPIKVIMPQLGESVTEGTISKWLIDVGDDVKEFDPLLEINTDKVDSEIPSPGDGTLLAILVEEGSVVTVGTTLAWLGEEGEEIPVDEQADSILPEPAPKKTEPTIVEESESPPHRKPQKPGRDKELGFISPVVAKISQEQNIDLSLINGTGQGGRITKKDVMKYVEKSKLEVDGKSTQVLPPGTPRPAPSLPGELVPHSIVRRTIAEHMVMSKHSSPHVSTVMEADLTNVINHRQANKEVFSRDGVNLTFTAYFITAAIAGLKSYPIVNSSWMDEGIQIHKQINFGMATDLGEQGLIVPVIRNVDQLSLLGLAKAINDLAIRARNNALEPGEVQGGTFTMTNHGTSGSLFATPIINQPQAGILGVGVIQKRVVVIDDAIAIRPMVYLTLTFDHRILDGAVADHFLSKVVESLQNWS